jgi:hypothetical protein
MNLAGPLTMPGVMSDRYTWLQHRYTLGEAVTAVAILGTFIWLVTSLSNREAKRLATEESFKDRCVAWYVDQYGRGEGRPPLE